MVAGGKENGPVRYYAMRDDMKKYTLDLCPFCGDEEKVATVGAKIEKLIQDEGLTCEEALMVPAYLYMRMEMVTREQLNTRKYSADITSEA